MDTHEVSVWLSRAAGGDGEASKKIFSLLYDEFRRAADQAMVRRDQRPDHSLQPTALVHEMFLRLDEGAVLVQAINRQHLFGIALRAYEQILVDHAREREARKPGGDGMRIPWDEVLDSLEQRERVSMEGLHQALEVLNDADPQAAEIVRRRFLWNQEYAEMADDLRLSPSQIARKWRAARAWLFAHLDLPSQTPRAHS